jgi:sulfate transport system permease protein
MSAKSQRVLPGFGLALGYTLVYLSLLILLPLGGMISRPPNSASGRSRHRPRRALAGGLSRHLRCVAAGGAINAFFGLIVAWMLVRYPFPGKRFVDALVDLPFALPTAVAGITLAAVCRERLAGQYLEPLGIKVAYTPLGIVVALTFITLPFVVRTLQPVIEDIETEVEEAAATLGASRWQTFVKVIFPAIFPALLTGFALAFARRRRVRFGHLHRRQPAAGFRNHAPADHLQAGAVRRTGRHGAGGGHAGISFVCCWRSTPCNGGRPIATRT